MAIVKAKARTNAAVGRVSEGKDIYLRALRDGSLIKCDWIQACIMEGRGFMVNVGAFSTGVAGGGAGTALDTDEPECVIGIPAGTSIMPIRVDVSILDGEGASDDDEIDILLGVDQDAFPVGGSKTATSLIYNMNTLHPRASNCAFTHTYTGSMTDPTLDLELAHVSAVYEEHTSATGIWTQWEMRYEPKAPPIINGPAMLVLHWGGTVAVTGFATVQWIELPSNVLTD